jgi:regulator of protease activity HflC (stomatin/prohibitin superfamily)
MTSLVFGFFIFGVFLLITSIRVVQQYEKGLILRVGRYQKTVVPGLVFLVPFMDVLTKVDMRERVINVLPQKVITKDNVSVMVDAVIYFKVVDPMRAEYEVADFAYACTTLAQTNLRNLIGDRSLDETLTARDMINASLRDVLDKATDSWGVKVTRVEVQKIDPPEDITNAMSKQMKAEREKRATILEAEGEKTSKILRAEGDRQSEILKAEGAAQAVVLKADAEARAVEQVSTAAENYFKDNAQILKRLEVLNTTLATNTKVILPTNAPILNLLGLDGQNLDKVFSLPKDSKK